MQQFIINSMNLIKINTDFNFMAMMIGKNF